MQTIAKITPADYPDLLAAYDADIPQRELADRYDCAPSLIARHLAKAKRARALGELTQKRDPGPAAEQSGSMREILEARIRDPQTSARDLASLINALARAREEEERTSHSYLSYLRIGTLILEPGPASGDGERRYRLMMRARRGSIEHVSSSQYDLTPSGALYLIVCALGSSLGLTPEDILGTTAAPAR
jgi:hypothetical protein